MLERVERLAVRLEDEVGEMETLQKKRGLRGK